jgi:hypothetical protein
MILYIVLVLVYAVFQFIGQIRDDLEQTRYEREKPRKRKEN